MDNELKREIILENFSNPYNKETVNDDSYIKINSRNQNCIDNIDLYIKFEDNKISDLKFFGEACAISTASTSIMIKNLIGKDLDDAISYINNFSNMCSECDYDSNSLEEGIAFSEIYKQNNRKNCVMLPYKGIIEAIDNYKKGN